MKRLDIRFTVPILWHFNLDNKLDDTMYDYLEDELVDEIDNLLYFRFDSLFPPRGEANNL